MAIKCIDISSWQSDIDFKKVKAAGVAAVIIRAGYGKESSQKDSRFETYYKGAKAAGLKVGAYWYSYAYSIADAALEAKACLACIKGKTFDLPVYYDMEEDGQERLGSSVLTQMNLRFCDAIRAGGFRAGVYNNPDWFDNYLDYELLRSKYSIWLAHWASAHSIGCDIWQYSSTGRVDGIRGDVDMNVIENPAVIGKNGSAAQTAPSAPTASAKTAALKVSYLGIGCTSPAAQVKTVQRLMNALGFRGKDKKVLTVDGLFGANTEYALKAFQAHNGAEADGIAGPVTWKLLIGAE